MKTEDRVKQIISLVFGISAERVDDNLTPENVESWDSVSHMHLVMALEDEFGLEFSEQQIVSLTGLNEISAVIRSLGVHD